jgi:uncharacterized membrane protein
MVKRLSKISDSITINADIEAVFDLIARVEEFPLYVDILKEVREIGYRTYRWVARIPGRTLNWDSIITEFQRPTRLTWHSIRGFENSGTYHLLPIPGGTRVELTIEYSFGGGLLDRLMEALVAPITRTAAASILARVKDRLENNHSINSAGGRAHRKRRFLHAFTKRQHPRQRP